MEEKKKYKKLFPIGSVVSVEGLENRFMIIGHLQKQSGTDTVWDYAAVPFPVGLIDPTKLLLFNHDKISLLSYIGLQDQEGLKYMEELFYTANELEFEKEEN